MKKPYLFTILLFITFLVTSCAKPESSTVNDVPITATSQTVLSVAPKPLTPQEEYIVLVESYIDDATFKQMDEHKTKELSDMLLGHYNITGRTAGEGMEYYLAVRRIDAPIYNDFNSINSGYLSGPDTKGKVFQVGYYDKDINPTILYEVEGYYLLEMPFGNQTLDCFCFGVGESSNENANPAFKFAFTESGRELHDFIKKNKGLLFYSENTPCIEFYYQDIDTLKFYSSPHSCYININNDELDVIRGHISSSYVEDGITSHKDTWKFLHTKDSSIRTTGANLNIDGKHYALLGNKNSSGYMMSFTDEHRFISLEYNEVLYKYVMDKIQDVVGIDYGGFDAKWFEIPLKSASINFPERIEQADDSYISELRSQTIKDVEKLASLSKLMDNAINSEEIYGFSGCPYIATIQFIRIDDETLCMFIATDSCDSMTYEGRIGFEYGNQSDLATIFDEAMAYRLIK